MTLKHLYTESPAWHKKIGDIHALLERVRIGEHGVGPDNDMPPLHILAEWKITAIIWKPAP